MLQRYRYRQRIAARCNQILTAGAKRIEHQDGTGTKGKVFNRVSRAVRLRWGPTSGEVAARCPDFLYAAQARPRVRLSLRKAA
jgi:hypothetical protein